MRRLSKEAYARGDPFVYNMAKGMNLALLGYVVAGQFVTVAYYPFLWIHLTFVTIMFHFWRRNRRMRCRRGSRLHPPVPLGRTASQLEAGRASG
jgi:hypothetical protein